MTSPHLSRLVVLMILEIVIAMSGCYHPPVVDDGRPTEISICIFQIETENLQFLFFIPQLDGI